MSSNTPVTAAKPIARLAGHAGGVLALAFSPDRGLLASSSTDATARGWGIAGSMPGERNVIRQHGDPFRSLAFFPNSRWIAVGSGAPNGMVWVFDVTERTPQEMAVLRGARGPIDAVAVSADGRWVAGGGEDHTVRV